MTRHDEHSLNTALAECLRRRSPVWEASAEDLDALEGLGRPDILVKSPTGAPVIAETEYSPARTVEQDAGQRLREQAGGSGGAIENAVALRAPAALREAPSWQFADRVEESEFEYAVFSTASSGKAAAGGEFVRFPERDWLSGGVDDLAGLIEALTVSERAIGYSTDLLEKAVSRAAFRLAEWTHDRPEARERIAAYLCQTPGRQSDRMAMAIVANACTFHETIAGNHGIHHLSELPRPLGVLTRHAVLREWDRILSVNYWPIFRIAYEILQRTPTRAATAILEVVAPAAEDLAAAGANRSHDLTGRTFQRLIADRKFLATYYTRPEAAALLAGLAVARLEVEWARPEEVTSLRIADLACGTGTLLSAAYQALLGRFRRAGGDDREIHPAMMEGALIAADIMPASTHLTATMLSSVHPTLTYGRTQVYTLPYGRHPEVRTPCLGSLSLLEGERMPSLFGGGFAEGVEGLGGTGAETVTEAELQSRSFALADGSLDLVIMNPPFTRPTNHEGTPESVPSFAGFGTDASDQRAMSDELKRLRALVARNKGKGEAPPASNGNAGLASNFLDLAHAKLRPGGTLALVMPASLALGGAWASSRALLARHYRDLAFITVAGASSEDKSFSADTGMAEVLVLGRKREPGALGPETPDEAEALWVSLRQRPRSAAEAWETERSLRAVIAAIPADRGEAGPVWLGGVDAGTGIRARVGDGGCAGVADMSVAGVALGLERGRLRSAQSNREFVLPMTRLSALGTRGRLDRDVGGRRGAAVTARGPFEIVPPVGVPTFPALWGHDASRERRMVVEPDSMGRTRRGQEQAAAEVWKTATRLHFNRDFQTSAQSLAACLTPEPVIGGRAWPSFRVDDLKWEEPLAAWANTTLGLLLFWWAGSVQQSGRTNLTLSRLGQLVVPDLRELPKRRVAALARAFRDLSRERFLEAHRAHEDPVRQELDRRVLGGGLGLGPKALAEVRLIGKKWCAEPTVHGGKLPPIHSLEEDDEDLGEFDR